MTIGQLWLTLNTCASLKRPYLKNYLLLISCLLTSLASLKAQAPVAAFSASVQQGCAPLRVTFRDESTGNPTFWNWEFGNGDLATTQNPTTTYTQPGTYTITLVARNADGTAGATRTDYITVYPSPVVSFTADRTTACLPANIQFTDQSTSTSGSINSWSWDFGDGESSTNQNPAHSYAASGFYNVTLTATSTSGCTATRAVGRYIRVISGITADFSYSNSPDCTSPYTVNFSNQTSAPGNMSYIWRFDDGTNVTTTNASHGYPAGSSHDVKLVARSDLGCADSVIKTVTVNGANAPFFSFNNTVPDCLDPLNVRFTAIDTNSPTAMYSWDFGGQGTAPGKTVDHRFASGGSYLITLTITDPSPSGCNATFSRNVTVVSTGGRPDPAFSVSDSISFCQQFETQFTFQGTNYTSYRWDFGDGNSSALLNPTHFYNDYGVYNARLYLTSASGCSEYAEHTIRIIQPTSSMITYNSPIEACDEITVDFSLTPPPSASFTFAFGDNQSDNTQATTLQHYYGSPGNYRPVLTLTDKGGCIATVNGTTIRVLGANPFYSQSTKALCDNGNVTFNSFIINNGNIINYTWDFGDSSPSPVDLNPVHPYTAPGVYPTSLTVTTQGPGTTTCTKTLTDTMRVYRTPTPVITNKDIVCAGETIRFVGSLAVADTSITWNWALGDGKTATTQNTSNTYTTAGDYTIQLQASNLLNCTGTTTKILPVLPPPVITKGPDPVIPVGTGTNLPVSYTGNIDTYAWTPSATLSCSDCAIPFANPQFTTTYNIAVTDQNGCTATERVTVNVVCNEENYFIPNTFSPNGDGMNDVFYPRGKGLYTIRSMRVFNRWGELVYEKKDFSSNDPATGWNGYYKGKPAGKDAYVYIAEIVCENAQIVVLKGNVTLIR